MGRGDGRQSVNRLRGAEPGKVDAFAEAFGGDTPSLGRNYRATPPIIEAFAAFSTAMRGAASGWTAHRAGGDAVRVMSAPTVSGEVAAIRERVVELHAPGAS